MAYNTTVGRPGGNGFIGTGLFASPLDQTNSFVRPNSTMSEPYEQPFDLNSELQKSQWNFDIDNTMNEASNEMGFGFGGNGPDTGGGGGRWGKMKSWFGSTDQESGKFNPGPALYGVQAATGLLQGYMALKNYGLAKKMGKHQRRISETNLYNQGTLTNAELEDRQIARVGANPNAYESVDSYMNKNRVKTAI